MTKLHRRRTIVLLAAAAALLAAIAASLTVGSRVVALDDVWNALVHGRGTADHVRIVRELRLPRTIVGLEVGLALGVAGVLMQSITHNPLAEPGLLGVNAGAALFVVVGAVRLVATHLPLSAEQ